MVIKKSKRGDTMLVPTKVQIDPKDYEFIRKTYKRLRYKSLSDYMRKAVAARVQEDRRKLREMRRKEAMEMLSTTAYHNVFESIEGDDFGSR
jgi:Arc/MetJ-type ribon-helix-helix transcriptional regulator